MGTGDPPSSIHMWLLWRAILRTDRDRNGLRGIAEGNSEKEM